MEELMKRLDGYYSKLPRDKQEVYIRRAFRFLQDRCFKLKIKGEVHYAMFLRGIVKCSSCATGREWEKITYGVEKYMGYDNREFDVYFINERSNGERFKLHWNDILRMKYEEITFDQFSDIVKLFSWKS